jgi:hypothetical protein
MATGGGKPADADRRARLEAELRRDKALRQRGYRERALQMFPHLCASCGRTFEGARLRELTVHHRDHDHNHNPADGSNWELLCLYCHDHEHEKNSMAGYGGAATDEAPEPSTLFNPFGNLPNFTAPPSAPPVRDNAPRCVPASDAPACPD